MPAVFRSSQDGESENACVTARGGLPLLRGGAFLWFLSLAPSKKGTRLQAEAFDLGLEQTGSGDLEQIKIKGFRLRRVTFVLAKVTKTASAGRSPRA